MYPTLWIKKLRPRRFLISPGIRSAFQTHIPETEIAHSLNLFPVLQVQVCGFCPE